MILAVIGLNGMLSFVVTGRTAEIGIRIAFRHRPRPSGPYGDGEIVAVILADLAVGAGARYLCAAWVETQLFGLQLVDRDSGRVACPFVALFVGFTGTGAAQRVVSRELSMEGSFRSQPIHAL
jgi:hypothetical protein